MSQGENVRAVKKNCRVARWGLRKDLKRIGLKKKKLALHINMCKNNNNNMKADRVFQPKITVAYSGFLHSYKTSEPNEEACVRK